MITPTRLLERAPQSIRRWALYFESEIEAAIAGFAATTPIHGRVLDAGAGEARHRGAFRNRDYVAVDLAIGDTAWNYSELDVIADLAHLPFATGSYDAALNIVTLEHLPDPQLAMDEIARVLKPGAPLLIAAPLEWEEHQQPQDFFRYTQFGLRLLVERAGLEVVSLEPAGGFFRLLSRRLLNGLQFWMKGPRWLLFPAAAAASIPVSLLLPLLDPFDSKRHFTLGYLCTARKPSSLSHSSAPPRQ